mgnify:CR=1 FL=1
MIKSVLDLYRKLKKSSKTILEPHEEIIVSMSASFDVGVSLHSHWKFCNVVLTTQRLVCYQLHRILASIPIKNILSLEIEKREWILGKYIKQLCIKSLGNKLIYLGVRDPEKWVSRIEYLKNEGEKISCQK